MNKSWALERRIELKPLKNPILVLNIDGTRNQAGDITHFIFIIIKIGKHAEKLWCAVTCLGKTPLILGYTWLQKHNLDVEWSSEKIMLNKCLSRPVLLIRSRREWRCEGDRRARGVWRIMPASNWGRSKVSRVGSQRSDGDCASNNQSTERTWPWM